MLNAGRLCGSVGVLLGRFSPLLNNCPHIFGSYYLIVRESPLESSEHFLE